MHYYEIKLCYSVTYVVLVNWNRNQHRLLVLPTPFPILDYWRKMKIRSFVVAVVVDFPKIEKVKEMPTKILHKHLYSIQLVIISFKHIILLITIGSNAAYYFELIFITLVFLSNLLHQLKMPLGM